MWSWLLCRRFGGMDLTRLDPSPEMLALLNLGSMQHGHHEEKSQQPTSKPLRKTSRCQTKALTWCSVCFRFAISKTRHKA